MIINEGTEVRKVEFVKILPEPMTDLFITTLPEEETTEEMLSSPMLSSGLRDSPSHTHHQVDIKIGSF